MTAQPGTIANPSGQWAALYQPWPEQRWCFFWGEVVEECSGWGNIRTSWQSQDHQMIKDWCFVARKWITRRCQWRYNQSLWSIRQGRWYWSTAFDWNLGGRYLLKKLMMRDCLRQKLLRVFAMSSQGELICRLKYNWRSLKGLHFSQGRQWPALHSY